MKKDSTSDTEIQPGIAAKAYESFGWKLVPFQWQTKSPRTKGWQRLENVKPVSEEWLGNIGLLHAYSGTCSIDIDDLIRASRWLFVNHDLDLEALLDAPDAVQITSPSTNRAKLLYRLPEPYQKVFVEEEGRQIIDFRCGTRRGTTCQDVLPPSMHPDGHQYEWGGQGHWSNLPVIPAELLEVWEHLLDTRGGCLDDDDGDGHAIHGGGTSDDPVELLSHVDPDLSREEWVEVGMAFAEAGGSYDQWDEWSAGGTKYNGPEDTRSVWDSFDAGGGVGVGTLYHHAIEGGWVRPRPSVEEMFSGVTVGEVAETLSMASIKAEITKLTVHDTGPVPNLIKRMCLINEIRTQDVVARPLCDSIALQANLLKSSVWDDFKKARKHYKQVERKNRASPASEPEQKVAHYLDVLDHPILHEPRTLNDLFGRYIYIASGPYSGKFFDRATAAILPKASVDANCDAVVKEMLGDEARMSPSLFMLSSGVVRVDAVEYLPGEKTVFLDCGENNATLVTLNTWRDTRARPVEGDIGPWVSHMKWLIQDKAALSHLLKWMAFTLRHQAQKINHQVIIGGAPRIGKDTAIAPLLAGLGDGNHNAVAPSELGESFQDWAADTKLAVFNELHGAGIGHAKLENILKPFAAAPPAYLRLRLFGVSAGLRQRNLIHILATTNYYDAFTFEQSPERWFAVWCSPKEKQPQDYYQRLWNWLLHEQGNEKVINYLLHEVDLSTFDQAAAAPETTWQTHLVEQGRTDDIAGEWVHQLHTQNAAPFDRGVFKAKEVVDVIHQHLGDDRKAKSRVTVKSVTCVLQQMGLGYSGRKTARQGGKGPSTLGIWCSADLLCTLEHATGTEWLKKYEEAKKLFSGDPFQ